MNKFGIVGALAALALVVVLADIVSAKNVRFPKNEFEHEHGCHGEGGNFPEFGHGPVRRPPGPPRRPPPPRPHRPRPLPPKKHHHGGEEEQWSGDEGEGEGAEFVGAGGVGAFQHEGEVDGKVRSKTKFADRNRIEGHKGFNAGDRKEVHGGFNKQNSNDNQFVHKHKVTNKNKFVAKESDKGVDDADEFRHHDDHRVSGDFGASDTKTFGANAGASASSEKEFDKDFEAGFHGENKDEAVGAAGFGAAKF